MYHVHFHYGTSFYISCIDSAIEQKKIQMFQNKILKYVKGQLKDIL